MVIRTDIKPFIVAGFVLVLINSRDGHPLFQPAKHRDSGLQGRMASLKKSCMDSDGNTGICMFKWDCISRQGIALSTCVDGFLFGACCSLDKILREQGTDSDQIKSTTDNEQNGLNTASLINYTTLNSVKQKTTPLGSQEDYLSETSSSFKSSNEFSEISGYDTTITPADTFTLTEASTIVSVTDTNNNKVEDLTNSYVFNDNSSHFLDFVETPIDYNNSGVNFFNNQTSTSFNSDNIPLISNLASNFSDTKKSEHKWKNDSVLTTENRYFFSNLFNSENKIEYSNELKKVDNNTMTVSPIFSENVTFENNNFSETILQSTLSENFAFLDSSSTESEVLSVKSEEMKDVNLTNTNTKHVTELHNKEKNMSLTVSPAEGIKISVSKHIVPSIWVNDTHIFPPGLQSVISQLISREASFSKPSVVPTTHTNLTSIMSNTVQGENFESFLNNDISNNLKLSLNNTDFVGDVKNNSALEYINGFYQLSGNEQNVDHKNSTTSDSSKVNISLHLINNDSYLNTSDMATEVKENSTEGVKDNNELTFDVTTDKKAENSVEESNYILSTNSQDILKVVCNNENKLSKYCNKQNANTETILYDNSPTSIVNTLLDITQTTQNLNFMRDSLNFNTISDENHKNENNKELTSASYQYDKMHVYNQQTFSTETYFKTTDDIQDDDMMKILDLKNSLEYGGQSNEEIGETNNIDVPDSISNSSGNEEFLFDITTDILTYFIKPDDDSAETVQSDFSLSTNGQNYPIQYTEGNSFSLSHTQQSYDSSLQYASTEIVDNLSSNYSASDISDNFNQNSFTTISTSLNFSLTNFSKSSINDEESTEYDLYNNNTIKNLTLDYNSSSEDYLLEVTEFEEPKLNFSLVSLNDTNTIISTSVESNQFDISNITEISLTFSENTEDDSEDFNNTKIETLNFIQSTSDLYNKIPPTPSVNNTIHATENSPLTGIMYNSPNHQTISQNVNISNNSGSLHSVLNVTNKDIYSSTLTSSYLQTFSSNLTIRETTPSYTTKKPSKNTPWDYKKDCGVRPMQPVGRIVGGRNSHFGKWPWQALVKEATWLGLFIKNKCGGVLITSKYVLTAAHCQPGFLASLLVVLGTHDISNLNDNGLPIIRNVKRMVVHRHYNAQTFENDLALLEMDTELEFMPHVVPICLPHRNEDFTGEMAFVTGWGKLTHGGDVPNILQEVQVPIVENSECQMMFYQAGHQKVIQNNFVCAGYTNGGQDSCEGDSGGPLMVQRKDRRWVLVGTVSHGIGCADPNLPGVYMRMSSYRPWIDSIVNK